MPAQSLNACLFIQIFRRDLNDITHSLMLLPPLLESQIALRFVSFNVSEETSASLHIVLRFSSKDRDCRALTLVSA